jgi:hypothetical protein
VGCVNPLRKTGLGLLPACEAGTVQERKSTDCGEIGPQRRLAQIEAPRLSGVGIRRSAVALSALKSIGLTFFGKTRRIRRAQATAPVRAPAICESLIDLGVYQKWRVLENAKGVFHPQPA